jgi:hypothetical protein
MMHVYIHAWTPASNIFIVMVTNVTLIESSLVTKYESNITSRRINGRVWNGIIHKTQQENVQNSTIRKITDGYSYFGTLSGQGYNDNQCPLQ